MLSFDELSLLREKLVFFGNRPDPPAAKEILPLVNRITELLRRENPQVRPLDQDGVSGGFIQLREDLPTLLVPDLHARRYFILHFLDLQWKGRTLIEQINEGSLQVVCVGDGFHSEKRGALRWKQAFQEYQKKFRKSPSMDEEMAESLGLMTMVMLLKLAFPDNFHFLKGNHENIRNEYSAANRPFGKFAYEGEMVKLWTQQRMGEDFLEQYGCFEDNLPILVQGDQFLVSHAEPAFFYDRDQVINYRSQPSMIFDFTWTANDDAQEDSVENMLNHYLPNIPMEQKFYFGGHRPVAGLYHPRANGKYIQFHNPQKEVMVMIEPGVPLVLEKNIFEL